MWKYTNDYQEISDQIDHTLEKEEELFRFVSILKRNLGIFAFLMSFFLMMEFWDKRSLRLKNEYVAVQTYNWSHEPVDGFEKARLLSHSTYWRNNYYGAYNPQILPSRPKEKKPIQISPPPNWALLRPQTMVSVLPVYYGCFVGIYYY